VKTGEKGSHGNVSVRFRLKSKLTSFYLQLEEKEKNRGTKTQKGEPTEETYS
jgi:hypothetical protein